MPRPRLADAGVPEVRTVVHPGRHRPAHMSEDMHVTDWVGVLPPTRNGQLW
jgi:hypothetical protein